MTEAARHGRLDVEPAKDELPEQRTPHDHRLDDDPAEHRTPLYSRALRLRRIRMRTWQRVLLGDGALLLAVLVVLADLASAWTLVVLPVAVAAVVKAHDVAAGVLARPVRRA